MWLSVFARMMRCRLKDGSEGIGATDTFALPEFNATAFANRWMSRTWAARKRKGEVRGDALGTCKNKRAVAKAPGRQCADDRVVVHPPTGYDNVRQGALHDHDHAPAVAPTLQLPLEAFAGRSNTPRQVSGSLAFNNRAIGQWPPPRRRLSPGFRARNCQLSGRYLAHGCGSGSRLSIMRVKTAGLPP